MKMAYIVDMQGFQAPGGTFIVKELAIAPVKENAMTKVFCFLPPNRLACLPVMFCNTNRWLEVNLHGIPWKSGKIPYPDLELVLKLNLPFCETVYVKGAQKVGWLRYLLPNVSIINLEKMGCPSVHKLVDPNLTLCTNHHFTKDLQPVCAMRNVKKLLTWLLKEVKVIELTERMSRCQCDCPRGHTHGKTTIGFN